jgi:hypothetical protein
MTGPEHFRRAEELAEQARKLLGQGDGQATAVTWAAVAQVHATLALAAATAIGAQGPDSAAWADATAAKPDPAAWARARSRRPSDRPEPAPPQS